MMDKLIAAFPAQLKEAVEIGEKIKLTAAVKPIHNIVVIGMGGSGIGADFAIEFSADFRKVPMLTCKSYTLPAFVNENSLVICSSFSGNTEETLTGFEAALAQGAKIICVAAGGKLIDSAQKLGLDYVLLPGSGLPPRSCLGYSLVQQLYILNFYGFLENRRIDELKSAISLIELEQDHLKMKAERIAKFLVGKFPVIYSTDRMGAVAVRLRQQLNENAKILCSHHLIPEMNHNELVGWRKQPGNFAVILFRTKDDYVQNQKRIEINKEIIGHYTDTLIEVFAKGDSLIEQAIYSVHLSDWLSWELSLLRQVDATEVKVIDFLKSELTNATADEKKSDDLKN
jgi:glucose/mannose-6-phosphate isomerase